MSQQKQSPHMKPHQNWREDKHSWVKKEKDLDSNNKPKQNSSVRANNPRRKIDREVAVSKALSKLLRHAAGEVGVKLDSEGYACVDQVLEWQRLKSLNVTFAEIQSVVDENTKQRFSLKLNPALATSSGPESTDPSHWVIRANQGHSIKIDSSKLLVAISSTAGNVPETVIHGTYYCFYHSIIKSGGLHRMTRTHIHFCNGANRDGKKVVSGMRNDAELLIYVDIEASIADGISWWLSDNGVILTEGNNEGLLSTKYFKNVIAKDNTIGVLWENGTEIKKLPESQEYKRPKGKTHGFKIKLEEINS